MPVRHTFPGVYIEEIPSGVRPVSAVATSTAAFIGTFRKGLIDEAVQMLSVADFECEYGGLDRQSEASYAINQFFLNGGTEAWVVRVGQPDPPIAPGTVATVAAGGTLLDSSGGAVLNFFAGRRIRGTSAQYERAIALEQAELDGLKNQKSTPPDLSSTKSQFDAPTRKPSQAKEIRPKKEVLTSSELARAG